MWENIWIDLSGNKVIMSVLLVVAGGAWLVQMFYMIFFFRKIFSVKPTAGSHAPLSVSVIIAARNEYHHLIKNLPLILEQDYPDYEVVLVNDASDDETEEYLKSMVLKYSRLNVVTIRSNLNFFKGKKFPLGLGIKAAKNEHLLLTDADCCPSGPGWIREMQSCFDEKTDIVLGYGAYTTQKGFLNKLIRWETVFTAMQYCSFALAGLPYMGVGRNLAYRKSLFTSVRGFMSHYNVTGGDDDLFVNQNAHGKNTRVCLSDGGFTYSFPSRTFSEWVRQKRRHITTGRYYRFSHQFLLAGWPVSLVLLLGLVIFLGVQPFNLAILGLLLLIRQITFLVIFKKSMNQLAEKKLLLFSLIFELFFILFYPLLAIINVFKKAPEWK